MTFDDSKEQQDELAAQKKSIREAMRERRYTVEEEERLATAKKIVQNISYPPIDLFTRSFMICVYLSTGHEIPTRYIVRRSWMTGKCVCVPAWEEMEHAYMLFEITPQSKLVPGKFGIREPMIRLPVQPWDVNAFILPGLAFDLHGGRLGYGGGYYDKILSQSSPAAMHIGICYDWQIQEKFLPQDSHDRKVDWVVSDKRIIQCSTGQVLFPFSSGGVS